MTPLTNSINYRRRLLRRAASAIETESYNLMADDLSHDSQVESEHLLQLATSIRAIADGLGRERKK
jgi:hypothetical protein